MSVAFTRLLPFLLRYQQRFSIGLACVVTTTAIQLLSPWVLKLAIDDLNVGVTRSKLSLYAGLLLVIAIVGGLFRFLMRKIIIGVSRDIEYDVRNAFFARLQQMPLAYYHGRRTGDLMSRATNDLNAVRTMIGPAVMYTTNTVLVFVVAIVLMASIDGYLTFIALLPLPLVSISVKYFGSAIHTRFEAIQAQLSEVSAVVQEALSGVRVVRAYTQEEHEMARFRAANEEYLRRNRVLIRLQGMFYPSMTLFLGFGSLLVLWLGSREAIQGRITVGEFVAFNAYLVMLSWPMIAFGWVTNILQRGMASWKRMLEVLDAAPAIDDRDVTAAGRVAGDRRRDRRPPPDVRLRPGAQAGPRGRVAAGRRRPDRGVRRRHRLRKVDAHQPASPGCTTLRPAPSSSTASTCARFRWPRFAPPSASCRRSRFSSLTPSPRTSPSAWTTSAAGRGRTTSRSSGCGSRPPSPASTRTSRTSRPATRRSSASAASRCRADRSSGRRIARAIMVDPRILVLDDALSAVDTYTEEEILTRLAGVMRERTSLIVSHRVSTVRDADQIFVLDRGRIVERGRHDALVAAGGLYAALHRRQLLEDELAAS